MRIHIQSGQAAVEGLIVLGVLASLWLGVAWLARLQDVALHAGHASRHQAFAHAHQGWAPEAFDAGYRGLPEHTWHSRHSGSFLDAGATRSTWARDTREPLVQNGDIEPMAASMRRDLRLGDNGVWIAAAHRQTTGVPQPGIGLRGFDQHRLSIRRHTAIMLGSGAATSDAAVQERIALANSVWAHQAGRSADLGEQVSGRVHGTDVAWNRAPFTPDWLAPWTAWVPAHHVRTGGRP